MSDDTAASARDAMDHRTFYFPWEDGLGYPDDPVNFARGLSKEMGLPLTVVAKGKSDIPDELHRAGYVTERSSHGDRGPSVVLLFYPTIRLFDRSWGNAAKYVAAEWPSDPLDVWAARHDGFNVRTGEAMEVGISDDVRAIYERILWNGNNGWFDVPGKRDALRDLGNLKSQGLLNKDELIGYFLGQKASHSLEQLVKLIAKA